MSLWKDKFKTVDDLFFDWVKQVARVVELEANEEVSGEVYLAQLASIKNIRKERDGLLSLTTVNRKLQTENKELRELADNHLADKKELEKLTGGTHWTNRIYDLDKELLDSEKKNRTLSFKLENIVKVAKELEKNFAETESYAFWYQGENEKLKQLLKDLVWASREGDDQHMIYPKVWLDKINKELEGEK